MRISTLSIATLLALSTPALAGTIYVDVSLASGANDGSSWANAFHAVDAVTTALAGASSGDQIWVARGTYKTTSTTTRTIYVTLRSGIEVYGGFAGGETSLAQRDWLANETILSGDLNGDDGSSVFTDNSFHVVNGNSAAATAVLDGFTIRGGNANGSGATAEGGGILCLSSSNPTIRHCRFTSNRCTFGGGAGYINGSGPTFTDCIFEDCVGGSFGGAFDMNTVTTTFDRCVFRRNTAARAGALEIFGSGSAKVSNCLFHQNTSTGSGGGGALYISGNASQIRDCTITSNTSTTNAAGGILSSGATPSIANCIVWNNAGPGGAMAAANQISPAGLAVTYCDVTGGYAGTGNIAADPQFVNAGAGDYRLAIGSPCVDAGNNASVLAGIALDLAGAPRISDEPATPDTGAGGPPTVDLGAYEVVSPLITTYCFGDGFGGACPCGNSSAPFAEEGCNNSLGIGGKLTASGSARIGSDTLVLLGTQMPNSSALYFQGTTQINGGNGATFGDGLRCAGGSIRRLGTKTNSGGASQYPSGADAPVSVRGGVTTAGSVRTYQVWYRNAAAFCAPETFNLTSALQVTWAP